MQKAKPISVDEVKSDCESVKPVCFFCNSEIKAGAEIVSRRKAGFYHRKCFNLLFNLTSNQVSWDKVQQ